jgi:hypothetical protein
MFHPNFRRKQAEEAAKHPTTTTTFIIIITASVVPAAAKRNRPSLHPQQQQMPKRTNFFSQPYLSPTRHAAVEHASPAALAQLQRQVQDHNIPYWGQNCVVRVLELADWDLQDVPIGALLAFPTLPFCVSYPTLTLVQLAFHDCLDCPQINYPVDSSNPPYGFHLKSTAENQPSSNAELSSSSSVAESQSSRHSLALSSSMAKLQLSRWYNSCSNNSSNLHSPGLDNWQSNRSSNQSSDFYIDRPSDNLSHPHSPGLDPWQSNGSFRECKGSSSDVYDRKTDKGQVPQGSGGSSSSSKG